MYSKVIQRKKINLCRGGSCCPMPYLNKSLIRRGVSLWEIGGSSFYVAAGLTCDEAPAACVPPTLCAPSHF